MLIQLFINACISGSLYILFAIGFSLIYRVSGFYIFSHGIIFTAGAYFAYIFKIWMGFSFFLSFAFAVVMSIILGGLTEILFYRPMRRKNSSSLILLLCSFGVYIVLQNVISIIFGDAAIAIRSGEAQEGINILGARVTAIQALIAFVSIIVIIGVFLVLQLSKIGKVIRAVACSPELASISGININKTILFVFALGSGLAGIAGILNALNVQITPNMGFQILMMGVIVVLISGSWSIPGIAFGGIFLGLVQNFGIWKIPSKWQDAIAFLVLLIFILFRPEGFFGREIKKPNI